MKVAHVVRWFASAVRPLAAPQPPQDKTRTADTGDPAVCTNPPNAYAILKLPCSRLAKPPSGSKTSASCVPLQELAYSQHYSSEGVLLEPELAGAVFAQQPSLEKQCGQCGGASRPSAENACVSQRGFGVALAWFAGTCTCTFVLASITAVARERESRSQNSATTMQCCCVAVWSVVNDYSRQ